MARFSIVSKRIAELIYSDSDGDGGCSMSVLSSSFLSSQIYVRSLSLLLLKYWLQMHSQHKRKMEMTAIKNRALKMIAAAMAAMLAEELSCEGGN